MYQVTVKKDNKVIRVRHFSTKKRAEDYENEQYKHNPIAGICDFEIIKIAGR
jgi:hypothetical protein